MQQADKPTIAVTTSSVFMRTPYWRQRLSLRSADFQDRSPCVDSAGVRLRCFGETSAISAVTAKRLVAFSKQSRPTLTGSISGNRVFARLQTRLAAAAAGRV